MTKRSRLVLIGLILFLCQTGTAWAQEATPMPYTGRDPVFEQAIYDKLSAIAPEAVPLFQQATEALDANNFEEAKRLYTRVLGYAPGFPDALRRMSYAEGALGNTGQAIQHARQAYNLDPSAYNQLGIANVLILTDDSKNIEEALTLAQAAIKTLPDDPDAYEVLLQVGIVANDIYVTRQAINKLLEIAPERPTTHFFAGLLAAENGEWEKAEQELLLSQKLGMPPEVVKQALDEQIYTQARWQQLQRWAGYGVLAWILGWPVLLALGSVLSLATLKITQRTQTAAQFNINPLERVIGAVYGLVILFTSIYFYVSLPLLVVAVLGLAGAILYLFFVIGRIPVQLLLIVVVGTGYTLFALVRSIFTRIKLEDPGRLLSRDESPALWAVAEEVAKRVNARPIDAIYISPGTEIAVTERGNLISKLRGTAQRCLILGLGVLPGLTQSQFKAILAHEYGHFTNRDTAGGNIANQVRISIHRMAYNLAVSGQAHWFNPAWLFINGFYRVFLRITLGASRLQEILADRYAAIAYGKRNFIEGLKHVVRQGVVFDSWAVYEVNASHNQRRVLGNLYQMRPPDSGSYVEKLEKQVDEAMTRQTSAYDSHPSMRYRIALIEKLPILDSGEYNPEPVLDLLPTLDKLQTEMMVVIRKNIRQR